MVRKRQRDNRHLGRGMRLQLFGLAAIALAAWGLAPASDSHADESSVSAPTQEVAQQSQSVQPDKSPVLPRGKKLLLKDGGFQLIREYKIEGDHVRYYSLDSHQWEEMPVDLVDWDATRKLEKEEIDRDAATAAKVRAIEKARTADMIDIDASLEAAPGVFLPPQEGVFVYASNQVSQLQQAGTDIKADTGRILKQILVPIPIVPSRHNVSIKGTRAKLRITDTQPEFYVRTADAHEPQMELIHAKVKGYERFLENIDSIFKKESVKADTVPMQRWVIAHGVFRFTLGRPLDPGEYALAEVVQEEGGNSIYVWDVGVDAGGPPSSANAK
jgi:hypothetical protein